MQLAELKSAIQRHMSDGLVTIIGSGLSCAEGLPSTADLAGHLGTVIGPKLSGASASEWASLLPKINSQGLEPALLNEPPSVPLEEAIREAVGLVVTEREKIVVTEVFQGKRVLRFTRLLKHLLRPTTGVQVVTTNYDRLIEVASEEAGLGVDTMFNGVFAGKINERDARLSFCRDTITHKNKVRLVYADRLVINKPRRKAPLVRSGRHASPPLRRTPLAPQR